MNTFYLKKSNLKFLIILLIFNFSCTQKPKYDYHFQNPFLILEELAENIVSMLTVEEKVLQMVNNSPAIERLGIPACNWWKESLHGVARSLYHVASFPQAIGMAATWDMQSLKQIADYCAEEGRAISSDSRKKGKTGFYPGLTYWTPYINVFSAPRRGRGQETYSEVPFLTGEMGKAFVKGLLGDDPKYLKASACAKHYAVHSGTESSRNTHNAKVTSYDLWDTCLPAFRDLVVDAKVSGVMCAFNRFNGQPCCGSEKLVMDILRKQWGFTGYVTSDCGGITNFWLTHKTHPTPEYDAADALLHGTDSVCAGRHTYEALYKALADGLITEIDPDVSLKRLFAIRLQLGMFDPDEIAYFAKIDVSALENEVHKTQALKMPQQSIVLLKNKDNIWPLGKSLKKIAVVGQNADDESVLLANYYCYPTEMLAENKVVQKVIRLVEK